MEKLILKIIELLQSFTDTPYICSKCEGATSTYGTYCDGFIKCSFKTGFEPPSEREEHLHITCKHCGFVWMETTADKIPE